MKRAPIKRRVRLKKKSKRMVTVSMLDNLWSKVVRQRGDWKCIVPGCPDPPQGSHILPKGRYTLVRHEPDNGFPCCYKHHVHGWHKDPIIHAELCAMLEAQRGPGLIERLRRLATDPRPPDGMTHNERKEMTRLKLEAELMNHDQRLLG